MFHWTGTYISHFISHSHARPKRFSSMVVIVDDVFIFMWMWMCFTMYYSVVLPFPLFTTFMDDMPAIKLCLLSMMKRFDPFKHQKHSIIPRIIRYYNNILLFFSYTCMHGFHSRSPIFPFAVPADGCYE